MSAKLVPPGLPEDDDDVLVSLETARALEDRAERAEASRWLQKAASAARKQGRPDRAGELSRLAARLGGSSDSNPPPPKFEPLEDPAQVLGEGDDEFADKTIVDEVPRPGSIAPATERTPLTAVVATSDAPPAPAAATPPRPTSSKSTPSAAPKLDKPTPVAPLAAKKEPAIHAAIRVAVRRSLGGSFEARPLESGDELVNGEEEALLVPLKPGVRLGSR